jgi:hypothetical protein
MFYRNLSLIMFYFFFKALILASRLTTVALISLRFTAKLSWTPCSKVLLFCTFADISDCTVSICVKVFTKSVAAEVSVTLLVLWLQL